MIFVTLGTQDQSFKRLLKAIDKEKELGNIKDKIVVQAGYTKYQSKHMEIFDYKSPKEIDSLMKDASIIITHGGVGSILGALKYNKPVIAAPRLSKYKEHNNDHQLQIVEEFDKEGYLLALRDYHKLALLIKEAKKFTPKKYKSNKNNFQKLIKSHIDEDYKSWWNKYKLYLLIIILMIILAIVIH